MPRPKIIADDRIPFLRGALEQWADVVYLPGAAIAAADVQTADALLTRTRTRCDETLLKGSNVRLIATATIGYDHIDTDWCNAAGICWTNAPGCNALSVQQYVVAALVTLARKQHRPLRDRTLGIIGVGNVGRKVAEAGQALGMRVLLNDPPRADREGGNSFTPLEQLLAESDIVTCHTPLETTGPYPTLQLADASFFSRMKPGSSFINSSRGAVVDTAALKHALEYRLADAVIDVWEGEPRIDLELLQRVQIGTPHIAGYSADGKANGTAACVNACIRFFELPTPADWYPAAIPHAPSPFRFALDGSGLTETDILAAAVMHTYPIANDSNSLKQRPADFEAQRGGYWTRREFSNFTIEPRHIAPHTLETLRGLGFNMA